MAKTIKRTVEKDIIVDVKTKTQRVRVGRSSYDIPVDDKGFVLKSALSRRFLDIMSGTRGTGERNPLIDQGVDAKKIVRGDKLKPKDVAEWWAHPNESDIEDIDTLKSSIFSVLRSARKSSVESQRKIAIIDATSEQSKVIRKALDASFTAGELKRMTKGGGITVEVSRDVPEESSGVYYPDARMIRIHPDYATESSTGTIVHEFIHHLKTKDGSRRGIVTRSYVSASMTNEERDLEEAETTAETITRTSPFGNMKEMSYYSWIHKGEPEEKTRQRLDGDRKLFVGNNDPNKRGLKGKRAINSVESKFEKSEIAEMRMHGNTTVKKTVASKKGYK